ncbi:MAG: dihydroneopterin triphosphate diphosphatase [Methylobacillus sp.]|jgi:dATP pyrophosphohydrolase|nr:dihydroneopterin triphosphate diphosphatase [Methylobacillus sp.]
MAYKQPVSVLVMIYTPQLDVLLLERADRPGFWQSVTGSCEPGETLRETAMREVFEETGLDTGKYNLSDWQLTHEYEIFPHWRHRYAPDVTHNIEHVFGLELPGALPVTLAPGEHLGYEWVQWRQAALRVFSWTNVEALRTLGERHGLTL